MARSDIEAQIALAEEARLADALQDEATLPVRLTRNAPPLPDYLQVPFPEMVQDLASRNPEVAPGWKATAAVYQRHGFAIAKSTDIAFTKLVQQLVVDGMRQGTGMEGLISEFRQRGLSDLYAENVYRTNVKTASMAGRQELASRPALRKWIVGFQYFAKRDNRVRATHLAMHSKMYAAGHPVWNIWVPPNGYQ
jgi:SPP1 gp7 family putative phage head morphogenesis protein